MDLENPIAIRVRGITNSFGDQLVHDNLDLDVRNGEILGVVGGSGTGKSVLMRTIIGRSADIMKTIIDEEAAYEIARRSRGTPRIGNALLRRTRDFAQIKSDGTIDLEIAQFALNALNVDGEGLDEMDVKILRTIIDKFKGGPVGLTTIATAIGEDAGTIEEVYEPYLIQEGFLMRTPRGREITDHAFKHLGYMPNYKNKLF